MCVVILCFTKMENKSCKTSGSPVLCFIAMFVSVAAQPGFLNIDCGGKMNSTDPETNMTWIADANYVNVGQTVNISVPNTPLHLQSMRRFPNSLNKSCYRFPTNPNVNYLLRLWFLYDYYDQSRKLPSFNVSFETEGLLNQMIERINCAGDIEYTCEKIMACPNGVLYICFIRTSDDSDPFVSAIQLRSLSSGMYSLQVKARTMLSTVTRSDFDINCTGCLRYPQDEFDRFWSRDNGIYLANKTLAISSGRSVDLNDQNSSSNLPPIFVLQSAITAKPSTEPLALSLPEKNIKTSLVLYFAEIEDLSSSEYRKFKIVINREEVCNVSLDMKNKFVEVPLTFDTKQPVEFYLEAVHDDPGKSNRGALINALEYFKIFDSEAPTDAGDADALSSIGTAFGMKNWVSDPCFSIPWNGIKCRENKTVRVVEIDLAGRNLSGSIPISINSLTSLTSISFRDNRLSGILPDLCSLTRLEILRLQNNNLSGPIPDCLSNLENLKELNLENNNFSGVVPKGLLRNKFLNIWFSGNPNLCKDGKQCHSKDNKMNIVFGSSVGAFVAASLALISIVMCRRRRYNLKKANQMNTHTLDLLDPLSCRSFSLVEMKTATSNFSQKIGEGGFGSVYFGRLPDRKDIAVKLLSSSSKQGLTEFLNEINLLSRVHHRNLVFLIGYCNESKELMLAYEHMCGGSLKDHLYGSLSNTMILDWKTRLGIALDAAQGLEYLHASCTPKIVHRDVKSSNILLDNNLRGKMADFGLSRIIGDEKSSSHITTTIKGTFGYLDPEYFHTNKLTEKSDVYSFGVVLLEMICGRKAIDPELSEEEVSLLKWVMLHVDGTDDHVGVLANVIDQKLCMSDIDMKSLYLVFNISLKCIQNEGSKRPTISQVEKQIKEAMDIIKPESSTEGINECLCSAEYSYSLLDIGR